MRWSDGEPLRNVKVLDLCRVVSGPFATMLIGDLGADILKVEEPGREPTPVASEHELDWKALVQAFRVHTVEHRRQIERVLAELGGKDLE